jgi:uracil phosphoribosyltransferase
VYVALFFSARSAYLLRQLQPTRYRLSRHLVTSVTPTTESRSKHGFPHRSSYCEQVRKLITEHPLISHKLTALRDERTDSPTFRRLADELVMLLAYEATRSIRVEAVTVQTPVAPAQGVRLAAPTPVVIPILRAGLGMLDGMTRLLPTAEVGFLGMVRDHDTLQPTTYADRIPGDLKGRQVFLLDPMLATGGTLIAAIDLMLERGANQITAICLLSAPEGIAAVEAALAGRDVDVTLVTAAVDEKLNEKGYIVPGLGDAGDRLFGVV